MITTCPEQPKDGYANTHNGTYNDNYNMSWNAARSALIAAAKLDGVELK